MELHVGIEPTSDAYKTTALTIELMERINGTIVVPTAYFSRYKPSGLCYASR